MITKQTLITQLHAKKIITTSDAIRITQQMSRFLTFADLLLHIVKNYNLQYKDIPDSYKEEMNFLYDAVKARPEFYNEVKAENVTVFRKLAKKFTIVEKKEIQDAIKAKQQAEL